MVAHTSNIISSAYTSFEVGNLALKNNCTTIEYYVLHYFFFKKRHIRTRDNIVRLLQVTAPDLYIVSVFEDEKL